MNVVVHCGCRAFVTQLAAFKVDKVDVRPRHQRPSQHSPMMSLYRMSDWPQGISELPCSALDQWLGVQPDFGASAAKDSSSNL